MFVVVPMLCYSILLILTVCEATFEDYDELCTGQRREGQLTMARDLVPKICEIPADALPFMLMSCLLGETHEP